MTNYTWLIYFFNQKTISNNNNNNMALVKINGKTIVNNAKVKFISLQQLMFEEFSIWNFSEPSEPTNITNFSVGFDSGTVAANWGSGDQTLQNNQPININI
jgi:hypothetical protein